MKDVQTLVDVTIHTLPEDREAFAKGLIFALMAEFGILEANNPNTDSCSEQARQFASDIHHKQPKTLAYRNV